ncbi:MAG: Fpg/Nei family DNA glycosylase [Actinomycetales bacterium]
MPEGNVIHHQARRLTRAFGRQQVAVDSPQGRFAAGAALIDGRRLLDAQAYGKHLFIAFEPSATSKSPKAPDIDTWVHVHLGLFGKWRIGKGLPPAERGLIRLRLVGQTHYAELRGPTACEVIDPSQRAALLARIGPDPIRRDADPQRAWVRVQRSRAPIAGLLMDQRVFAGVGNIYRAEVLFRHNISPFRPGNELTWADFEAIWDDLVELMRQGTKRGRIDTVRTEHRPEAMGRDPRQDRHGGEVYVYRRADRDCFLCGDAIQLMDLQGRKLYWCPSCQVA